MMVLGRLQTYALLKFLLDELPLFTRKPPSARYNYWQSQSRETARSGDS